MCRPYYYYQPCQPPVYYQPCHRPPVYSWPPMRPANPAPAVTQTIERPITESLGRTIKRSTQPLDGKIISAPETPKQEPQPIRKPLKPIPQPMNKPVNGKKKGLPEAPRERELTKPLEPAGKNVPEDAGGASKGSNEERFSAGANIGWLRQGCRTLNDEGNIMFQTTQDGRVEILKRGDDGVFRSYGVGDLYADGSVVIKTEKPQAPEEKSAESYSKSLEEKFSAGASIGLLRQGYRTLNDEGNIMFQTTQDGRVEILKRGDDGAFRSYGIGDLYADGNVVIKTEKPQAPMPSFKEPLPDPG